jgi:hypothetical protein
VKTDRAYTILIVAIAVAWLTVVALVIAALIP